MEFARKVWKLLVAVKDGLVLLFVLAFFTGLYAVLSLSPERGQIRDGALLLKLDGVIVEEPSVPEPLTVLLSGQPLIEEYRARDLVRGLRLAAEDERVKVVVLDLSGFGGGGFVHLQEIGEALEVVRAAGKPVLAYSIAYLDDGMQLAAHADEIWVDPMGGAFITGPGGSNLYFGRLLENLKITAHVFRVGTFKSAVEPFTRNEPSPASREAFEEVYGALWNAWKADFAKARPNADIATVTNDPVGWLQAADGDVAQAGKAAGIVDRIGNKTEFGMRVAELAGESDVDLDLGAYAHTDFRTWIGGHPEEKGGKPIGVITVAGEIVDGDAGPGVAGGDRISELLIDGLDQDYAALVVRVDSPGGSVMASEQIREALMRYKEKDIPVIVSMANVAASGGYWVSTPAQRIFAEPATITGSIGVFAIVPSFERALAEIGVTGAGVKTTPLSGQPDVLTGLAPEVFPMVQSSIENIYSEFITLVTQSRQLERPMEDWAEGRPWSGGAARRLGLVDEFGGLDDALAYAAKAAGLSEGAWHADFLGGQTGTFADFLFSLEQSGRASQRAHAGDLAGIAAARQSALLEQAITQARRLGGTRGVQAYCIECPPVSSGAAAGPAISDGMLQRLAQLAGIVAR